MGASSLLVGLATGSASITATSAGRTSPPISVTVTDGAVNGVFTTQGTTFTPAQITIRTQQSVAVAFLEDVAHNAIFRDRATAPRSAQRRSDDDTGVVTRTFTTAGTFPFECTLHPGMTGQVVVTP